MAKEVENEEIKNPEAEGGGGKKSFIGKLLPWAILVVVVIFCAGAGFGLGRIFAGSRIQDTGISESQQDKTGQNENKNANDNSDSDSDDVWYYDLDPVVANLNEPSVTRYVSATLTLQLSASWDQKKGVEILEQKKPILINWLTVYLSGLTLEDIRGDRNLKSIQATICQAFNDTLFPNSKPHIKQVLIKGFPVQ